ncbi:hypothetical protein VP01_3973g3 [Puccinia sorghi]|uniref:Uncharacterized protein n=1 Tax=Puccinia sorghi TaxID=27349 RepID=A0A0L6USB7_9BASI|nr:hypothetical protein VP01_3973g3 [Puccinia sorghi]
MGLSCQLFKKSQALEKIKNKFYEKHPTKSHLVIRDMNKIIPDSACYSQNDLSHFCLHHVSISLRIKIVVINL